MRVFAIADASKRRAEPIGVLVWWPGGADGQGRFALQLARGCDERRLPLSVSFCARREGRCATLAESEDWVRSRIVPESRHNIGEVLRANGLSDYDEVALLAACKGRSSDDDLLAHELDLPEGFDAAPPPPEAGGPAPPLPPLFADELLARVERTRRAGEVRYAFVGLGGPGGGAGRGGAPTQTGGAAPAPNAAARIGAQVRTARREAGLTQTQLAARAGMTQTVLSRVESGRGNPTLSLLEEIAAALGSKLEVNLEVGEAI